MSQPAAPKTATQWPEALPPELSRLARSRIGACIEAASREGIDLPQDDAWPGDTARVFACSEFVASYCEQRPDVLRNLLESGALAAPLPNDAGTEGPVGCFKESIDLRLGAADSPTELMAPLRRLRRREWVRIAWRYIGGLANL